MQETNTIARTTRHRAYIKAFILLALAALSIAVISITPLKTYLTPGQIQAMVSDLDAMGPVAFGIFCIVATCLFVPGTIFIGIGAAIFGPYLGFLYVWAGTVVGAAASFLIARGLGRDFVSSTFGKKLRRYDDLIERNGFTAVLFIRLMCMPLGPASFALGLSRVRFSHYFMGTAMGEIVSISVVTFLVETLRQVWLVGDWSMLLSGRMALSLGLLLLSILIPKLVQSRLDSAGLPNKAS